MAKIHLLDQNLINKISAGEVVERPASVVKELVENSIDAGADQITVEIEEGGHRLIKVIDNGSGMSPDDAQMALRRHATSKIRELNDLHKISTLGFRGEALAAISSVSSFRLLTKEETSLAATELHVIEGQITSKEAAGQTGTIIEVKGLFDTVPARKKFLKSANAEFRQIVDVFTRQALLLPNISFKLTHNGKQIASYAKTDNWKHRVQDVLGPDLSKELVELHYQRASLVLNGFLGYPSSARERQTEQYLFVNGRAVSDYTIARAIQQGYGTLIANGFKPAFVVHLTIAPDLVDVNVHPRKAEVKFADPSAVYREVYHAVKQVLSRLVAESVSSGTADYSDAQISQTSQANPQLAHYPEFGGGMSAKNDGPHSIQGGLSFSFKTQKQSFPSQVREEDKEMGLLGTWKLIGQSHNCYLIVEDGQDLLMIDQHAAAERVLLEKLLALGSKPKVQQLLVPEVFELSAKQWSLLTEQMDMLSSLGVEGEEFGERTFRLTGVPQDLTIKDLRHFFLNLLEEMEQDTSRPSSVEERRMAIAQMAACKAAVTFHQPLTREEQLQLMADIQTYNAVSCCHGRPTIFGLSVEELNKKFHRH